MTPKPPPFGETPKEIATYLKLAFDNDLETCLMYCEIFIISDITPDFYEKVKIELRNNENNFGS